MNSSDNKKDNIEGEKRRAQTDDLCGVNTIGIRDRKEEKLESEVSFNGVHVEIDSCRIFATIHCTTSCSDTTVTS